MECHWDAALLRRFQELPEELIDAINSSSDEHYLDSLTLAALQPRYTYTLFAYCRDVFAHICADLRRHGSLAQSIATLGRIIPFAPNLSIYARRLLEHETYIFGTNEDPSEDLNYLLGLFRLLRHDHRTFRSLVSATTITGLLSQRHKPIVYLAIRILQICLNGADAWFEHMMTQHCGDDASLELLEGAWDDKTINYRFLSLWEEERQRHVEELMLDVSSASETVTGSGRTLGASSLHIGTCLYGGVLLPRYSPPDEKRDSDRVVHAPSTVNNMHALATALQVDRPLLVTGLPGSGKTMLIRNVARELGQLDRMITLHLNEQSDAKALIGVYATGSEPGTFTWRAGVLTTAVQEGRWVVIEDLDRAPQEIIGALLPLIERRELTIPNRGQTLHAHHDFRLLATTRSRVDHKGDAQVRLLSNMIGRRHWLDVSFELPSDSDLSTIAMVLYPTLRPLMPQFLALFTRLTTSRQQKSRASRVSTGVMRPISPRDFLKWCQRTAKLMQGRSTLNTSDFDAMYLEAMDCFCGALPHSEVRLGISALIAEELRIDPQRRDFLEDRDARYEIGKERLFVGRYTLAKELSARQQHVAHSSFSTNAHTSRMLERVAAAVSNREPLLLVGETGVGKTTAVQHLARQLGKRLVPFNLSQQTEAGDLLGGFKPVNARSSMIPLHDDFSTLFATSFSATKNEDFTRLLAKAMSRGQWKVVCKLWRQALQMVEKQRATSATPQGETARKRRKTDVRQIDFKAWDIFADRALDIERRLSAGQETFAFSFAEGIIVKAVRNGDWVLLDEINLASSDTLDSLADLLDPDTPSLLLTEAGDVESVKAHPGFRLFAAMNPATDIGKKDLPPGIRSRFTELYVESPDRDLKSLQSIVGAYLRDDTAGDESVAFDVSVLYQKIIGLADQNRLVDGAGQKPHFSLRTLTRTLSYARYIAPHCSLRRALYEGFQMSFLTFLDAESSKLVEPLLLQHLFSKKTNVRTELKKSLRSPQDGHSYLQAYPGSKHWVRQGRLPLQEQSHYIITPFIRDNLENLVRASSTRKFPVLIQGPTSSGKTSMIEYLAKRTGHHFVRINNHEHTDLQEYLGTYISTPDGRLEYQEGILVRALREGHWIVLDELNLAPTDVLEALNRLLDDNRELLIPETREIVRPHESFMLFATQNPAGLYGGRKTLSRAFRNRFLELHFDDIPVNELQEILHKRTQLPESRCKRIVTVYRELSVLRQENRLFEQKSFATLRDLFRWALRPNDTIEQLAANGYMLLAERVRKAEERDAIKAVIEKAMSLNGPKVSINDVALYGSEAPEIMMHSMQAQHHEVVWTKAMRRLYTLVARAIQHDEPVLLVGETGCGKTTVCQMLADALRQRLSTVNAHQNTETGDLIGSQRPVRNRAANEIHLRSLLLASDIWGHIDMAAAQSTDDLLRQYDLAVVALAPDARNAFHSTQSSLDIQIARTRYKALFEWVDGTLVEAMRTGSFFLLDEISLADDSVLERINSVLESSRSILLAEKGVTDSFVTAESGFQFFATMNPGGDYGKRELSPALRNRFTEIWVPALSDLEDIVQIVQAKLSPPMSVYADAMVGFARWFNERYNTSTTSAVSIRDVLAWTSFVNLSTVAHAQAAVVNGAAMVYVDTLGANPAGLMTAVSSDLAAERRGCIEQLSALLHSDEAATIYYGPIEVTVSPAQATFGVFALQRAQSAAASPSTFSFETPTAKVNAMRVVRAMQLTKPILLEGSPGVGKTALVTAISATAGVPLTRINLSEQTDLMDLFGSDVPVQDSEVGTFVWQDAPFLRAMKNGEWVLLDEMNLASQSVLEGLNACLDHRGEVFVPEIGQSFTRHANFRLFAAQNPHHQGGGRKGLPASFVNRFTVVYADALRSEDLMLICQRTFAALDDSDIAKAVRFVSQLDAAVARQKRFGAQGGPWEFNLRDITRWLALVGQNTGMLTAGNACDFVEMLFAQRFRSLPDRTQTMIIFKSVYGTDLPRADLASSVSPSAMQLGLGLLTRHPLYAPPSSSRSFGTAVSRQLYSLQSLMIAVNQAWPIILSGCSGIGKTAMIEGLASSVGASLKTFTMNAETDAMDLIGGYEQADPHREMSALLQDFAREVEIVAKTSLAARADSQYTAVAAELRCAIEDPSRLSGLAQLLEHCDVAGAAALVQSIRASALSVDKARFVWIDGFLVNAMLQGRWLVLDNANLCSPSVLDRLNSLLEPNGLLIMSEHVGDDGAPRIIRPHADFRIFLTVDPRYGDLSRAMRNRALEIHLLESTVEPPLLDPLNTESAVARFRNLQVTSSAAQSVPGSLELALDQLAIGDQPRSDRFTLQMSAGLNAGAAHELWQIASRQSGLRGTAEKDTLDQLEAFYQSVVSHKQVPADFACVQSIHPLNNQPLVQGTPQTYLAAQRMAFSYELRNDLKTLHDAFRALQADRTIVTAVMRAEKQQRLAGSKGTSTILQTLVSLLEQVYKTCANIAVSEAQLAGSRRYWQYMIAALRHICDTCRSQSVQSAVLSASLDICYKTATIDLGLKYVSLATAGKAFSAIVPTAASTVGTECLTIWQSLRPKTPVTEPQLHSLVGLEDLIKQIDGLALRFRQPVGSIVALRQSCARALMGARMSGADVDALAARLRALVIQPNETTETAEILRPCLVSVFDALSRHLSILRLGNLSVDGDTTATVDTLALRPVMLDGATGGLEMLPGKRALAHLPTVVHYSSSLDAERSTHSLADNALHALRKIQSIPLKQLQLLQSEVQVLGRTVATQANVLLADQSAHLDRGLKDIVHSVLGAIQRSDKAEVRSIASRLDAALSDPNSAMPMDQEHEDLPWIEHMSHAVQYLSSEHSSTSEKLASAAAAWRAAALACFYLYLPAISYDPALELLQRHAIHKRNEGDLVSRLEALKLHACKLTSVKTSLRVRLLDSDLQAIGPAPELPPVHRPAVSELASLQMEFDGLWRVVKALETTTSNMVDSGIRSNLTQIRRRLADQYRAYDDFTTPVLGFIDCLFVSDYLTSQVIVESRTSRHVQIGRLIPFADSSIQIWQSDQALIEAQAVCSTTDERIMWLAAIAARSAVWPLAEIDLALVHQVESQFARLYDQWRSELNKDQRDDVAKSSLYRFVGDADLEEDPTDDQLDEFLQGSVDADARKTDTGHPLAIREMANRIAALHHRLCAQDNSENENILGLLTDYAQAMPRNSQGHKLTSSLPMLMLQIQGAAEALQEPSATGRVYNMYADANPVEIQRLGKLIGVIQERFGTLRDAWPDHSTPADVLVLCDQILARSHSDPLPDFIPLLEKLHAMINEWQKIASREYSAAVQYESITDLIIDWRRLELSSWAGMFGQAMTSAKEAAATWWFVAYETIIAATETLPDDDVQIRQHVVGLLGALESFMLTSGLGEYQVRLDLLRDFEAHASLRSRSSAAFRSVHEGLANIVAYYSHFQDAVQQALITGRATLEKSLKEMIKLASWKDRNIATLRQSAKASHRKLFRLVRKFRALLAQPVAHILQAGVPDADSKIIAAVSHSDTGMPSLTSAQESELSMCLSEWAQRAPRFRNVDATVALMQSKGLAHMKLESPAQRLDAYLEDLASSIKALQKETPTTLTAENKVMVNHLKTRKRRLLADVLKSARGMGLQHNLGQDLLSKQSSFSSAMAQLRLTNGPMSTSRAMHQFLGVMPSVREATRKHSEDLTPAETARCVAYLESMLSVTIGQHNSLAEKWATSKSLQWQLDMLQGFADCTDPAPANLTNTDWDLHSAQCAAQMLRATASLTTIQGRLGSKDFQPFVENLTDAASSLDAQIQAWQTATLLPSGIVDDQDAGRLSSINGILQDVLGRLVNVEVVSPELGYLATHLKGWLCNPNTSSGNFTNGVEHCIPDVWLQKMLSCLDTVLAAVQRVDGVFATSTADEHESSWLVKHQQLQESAWNALSCPEISQQLAGLVSSIRHVKSGQAYALASLALASKSLSPVLHTYMNIGKQILEGLGSMHEGSARLGHVLSKSFITLAKNGFCSPPEKSQGGKQEAGDVEAGTGLGDGEGGEDISKDVGADEDLSELAQEKNKAGKDDVVEDENDAVDMADQEMEGELGDVEGETSDGEEAGDDEEKELDEEAGSVGDLDDGAVDEKMWDEGKAEQENSKEADSGETTAKDKDLSAAAENSKDEANDNDADDQGEEEEEETMGAGEEDVSRQETEAVDPHMPEQGNLDLPDDINMEDASDSDGMSDMASTHDDDLPDAGGEETDEPPEKALPPESNDIDNGSEADDEAAQTGEAEDRADEDADVDQEDDNMLQANNEQQDEPADGEVAGEQGSGMETEPNQAQAEGGATDQDQEPDEDTSTSTQQASGTQSGADADQQASESSQAAPRSAADKQKAQYQELGNVLDEWYRQQKEIHAAEPKQDAEDDASKGQADVNMADAEFEHLADEAAEADTQALGTASADQSGALNDETSRAVNEQEIVEDVPFQDMPDDPEHDVEVKEDAVDNQPELAEQAQEPRNAKAMVGDKSAYDDIEMDDGAVESDVEDVDDVDDQLLHTHISSEESTPPMTLEEARSAWAEHESSTRNLALILTEHLRLILHPTQATKMRGDFRTGKRLNIKRIIPYIASSYKRDKIWMRRSIPSKRSYQIMLAIDDSKSMDESDSKALAFETLALVAKSMSMLEVGEICVLGFGEEVKLAHDFSTPFTSEAGAEVFQSFTFAQSKTNVRKMLAESIDLFRTARLKATGSASELWQLQLIISDGVCEDHPSIRQLVRQAFEERIMVVFIIVDVLSRKTPTPASSSTTTPAPSQSILDLQTAEFSKDAAGEMQLKMVKYLDTFPFQYYLIVRDVQELPGVLAGALRQWFAEVVEAGER